MTKKLRLFGCIALAAIVLAGCRFDTSWTIKTGDTVDGRIYLASYPDNPTTPEVEECDAPCQESLDAYIDSITAQFINTSVVPHDEGKWKGYYINIYDEPLASFAEDPTDFWDVKILKSGGQYMVWGFTPTVELGARGSAYDLGGYLYLDVDFPGTLVTANYATESNVEEGWAHFDLLSQPLDTTPYAQGNGPAVAPEPEPVQTVVIVPEPDPVVTTVVTPSVTPSASPEASPLGEPVADEGGDSIPVWVWVIGGILVAALAGLIGFAMANRKPPAEVPPVTKPKPKAKVVEDEPEEVEAEDDEGDNEEPAPKKK